MQIRVYFPEDFEKNTNLDENAAKIKLANVMLDAIIEQNTEKYKNEIYECEKELLTHNKPHIWNSFLPGNMENKIEVDFRTYSMSVVDYLNINIEKLSVFDFYVAIGYLKDKFKPKKKNNG